MALNLRLGKLLHGIATSQTVDARTLVRQLSEEAGLSGSEVRAILGYSPSYTGKQIIEILDPLALSELCRRFPHDATATRTHAAMAGNSHRAGVSGALCIMDRLAYDDLSVCKITPESAHLSRPFGQYLVVIENEELLLQKPLLRRLLWEHCDIPCPQDADLLLGNGNRAASSLHANLYREYDEVGFLLDMDLGGIKTFQSILALPGLPSIHFLLPDNIEASLDDYIWRNGRGVLSAELRGQLSQYEGVHPDTDKALRLIDRYRITPEQEIYLSGLDPLYL